MVVALLAALAAATGPQPAEDSVTGSAGTGDVRDRIDFVLDAHSGPSGEHPGGTVTVFIFGNPTPLPVTCMSVSGNRATVIAQAPPASIAGFQLSVQDGGPGGQDHFEWQTLQTLPSECPAPATVSAAPEGASLTVVDAPPPPTTYAQCRMGGWVGFGFDSRASCIAYVHDWARRACIFERAAIGIVAFRAKYGLGATQHHAMRHCVRLRTRW